MIIKKTSSSFSRDQSHDIGQTEAGVDESAKGRHVVSDEEEDLEQEGGDLVAEAQVGRLVLLREGKRATRETDQRRRR